MKTSQIDILTDVEVPESLGDLSEHKLRILRDKLIIAGLRKGGVDIRLSRVVEAFQAAMKSGPPKPTRKGDK